MQFFAQQWWKSGYCAPVSHIFTVVCCKFNYFKNFNSWKMLKMLKIGCFKQNYCISGMPQGIPMQFFAQQWWKSGYCDQFHTYSQWFAVNLIISKNFNSWKMLKMLKIGFAVLSKITVSQVCLKVFPCNFLLNSGESQVTVTSFTHIHSGLL